MCIYNDHTTIKALSEFVDDCVTENVKCEAITENMPTEIWVCRAALKDFNEKAEAHTAGSKSAIKKYTAMFN